MLNTLVAKSWRDVVVIKKEFAISRDSAGKIHSKFLVKLIIRPANLVS